MKSNLISKKETAILLDKISALWKMDIPKTKNLMVHHILDDAQIITGNGIKALRVGDDYLPFLTEISMLERFPSIVVDMGAVKFMCKGANVMRPGVIQHAEFKAGEIVCVVEESHHKFLAVGKALVDSPDIAGMQNGEIVKNAHYISDKFWEIDKTIQL